MDRRAGRSRRRRRRPRRPRAGVGRSDGGAPRCAGRGRRSLRRTVARRHRWPGRRAGTAGARSRRLRPGRLSGRRPGHPACGRPGPCRWIWPRSPTNWTPRRCATAPAASCSPIPPRRWPIGCRGATFCWRATTRRRSRWPATAGPSCCVSPTRPVAAVGSGRCARRTARRDGPVRAPTMKRRCSTTRKSTDRGPSGSGPSCWPPMRSGRWSSRG